jgi:lipopolysaccharide cholinephosphotransferase
MHNGESEDSTVLRRLQLTELEILKEAVRICETGKLRYFLTGGTLLGAVRHKGFIPWDDDIDIAMPRKDYEQFLNLCSEQLDSRYYVHDSDTDPSYWLPFAKIRKHNTVFDEVDMAHLDVPKGIYVDIFPLDSADKQASPFQGIQARVVRTVGAVIIYRKGLFLSRETGREMTSVRTLLKALLKILLVSASRAFSMHALSKLQQRVMSWNRNDDAPCYVSLGSHYRHFQQAILKDMYLPATEVEFEGEMFSAPRDWDYILRRIYGDYMKLPPEDKRVTHNPVRIIFDTQGQEDV